jgi:hypothetical protein
VSEAIDVVIPFIIVGVGTPTGGRRFASGPLIDVAILATDEFEAQEGHMRGIFAATVVAILALTGAASAQDRATVVKTNGDVLVGDIAAIGDRDIVVDSDDGQRHRFHRDEVAVIDFVERGQEAAGADLRPGQQLVVLRNGDTFQARLDETTRDAERHLAMIFLTDGGRRVVRATDVERIHFAGVPGAVATTGSMPELSPATGDITVPGNQAWTRTGLQVRRGDRLTFQTTGQVRLSTAADDVAGPAGALSQRLAPAAPLRNNFAGALIAKVGINGQPFPIGDQTAVTMPEDGELYLGSNDDEFSDNSGAFGVTIGRALRR